ncbi:MAG: hypothetical protein H0T89_34040 [Deltaproteobacteria bacterium]|nr:hypothetical protein [Deltaproteobacteria bacterium]MDQ3295141.1 hypothetical protein [Myxococcota bacterium]
MKRSQERGSAMLVTMIIIAALLGGAAVLASMQMSSNRSTELTRNGLASLYCAEAGVIAAHTAIGGSYDSWNAALAANIAADPTGRTLIQPAWLNNTVFDHDLDNDGIDDFTVSIRDNDDELGTLQPDRDSDERVFIVSRCIKYPDTPKQVEELIHYVPAANPYKDLEGGVNSRGNDNDNRP